MSQSFTKQQVLDTDPTLAGNADYIAPSQSAVKSFVDNRLSQADATDLTDGGETTLHTHAASGITSGTMATARLGSGTADATTALHGDQTYKAITPADGWLLASDTWTRTGNHTFTVSGDVTATYRKGAKVRYKDGGSNEYGVIYSSSYSAPNTTVTLIANSDYAMAAATITDKYLSYVASPEGFPGYFNYATSWTTSSSPQPSLGNGTLLSKWFTVGNKISFQIYLVGGSTTTFGTNQWFFSLPSDAKVSSVGYEISIIYALDFGTMNYYGFWYLSSGVSLISILRDNTVTPFSPTVPFTWTTNDVLSIKGEYEY